MAVIDIKTRLKDQLDNFDFKKFYDDCEKQIEDLLEENEHLSNENKNIKAEIARLQIFPERIENIKNICKFDNSLTVCNQDTGTVMVWNEENFDKFAKQYIYNLNLTIEKNKDQMKANRLEIRNIQCALYKNNSTPIKTISRLETLIKSKTLPSIKTSRERHRDL